jgi:malate permease and related proteins
MEDMILHVATVVAPVLLCVLVGFALARLELPFDRKSVSALVSNVGYPTLILSHLTQQHVALEGFLRMMLAALLVVVCFGLIGFALLKLLRLPIRAYLSSMMLNNVGNVGLPICALAFGNQGLSYAMAFVVVVLVGTFTVGIWLPMGEVALTDIWRKPVIYAVVLAILMLALKLRLPGPIEQAFTILGGLAIPLMLLTLGHTLATLQTGDLWPGFRLAFLHLAMASSVAVALVHAFDFHGTARGVLILQCVMPIAVSSFLWVEMYDPEDAPGVASLILGSTLLSVAALPLVLTYWV